MNLNHFIDVYGDKSFDDVGFTEVDNVIFSALSYINLEGIVPLKRKDAVSINYVGEYIFNNYDEYKKDVYVVRKSLNILMFIKDTKRYRDLLLYGYMYEIGDEEQFGVVSIEIKPDLVYVSFEGTDRSISGWRENFMLCYLFPTVSQKRSIDYVNSRFLFSKKKIILGGHSKGGNLAVAASLYANIFVRKKIMCVYNNDGPGFLPDITNSKRYERMKDKIITIVPNYSIVGVLLDNSCGYKVVRSMKKNVYAHDFMTWVVMDKEFELSEFSFFSKNLKNNIDIWLSKYDYDSRKKFVISLFDLFDDAGIKTLLEIKERKMLIFELIKKSKNLDDKVRKMLREFVFMFLKVYRDVSVKEMKIIFKIDKN